MSYTNKIISDTGVCIGDVKLALGTSVNYVGRLCTSRLINIWSKYKPIDYPLIEAGTTAANWKQICKDKDYGLSLPDVTSSVVTAAGRTISYVRPKGGASSPYRLGDFRGYYSDAKAPIRGAGTIVFDASTKDMIDVTFPRNATHANAVSFTDIKAHFKNRYLGIVICEKGSTTPVYAVSSDLALGETDENGIEKWNIIKLYADSGVWANITNTKDYTYYAVVFNYKWRYDDARDLSTLRFHCHLFGTNAEATGTFTATGRNINLQVTNRLISTSYNSGYANPLTYDVDDEGNENAINVGSAGTLYFAMNIANNTGTSQTLTTSNIHFIATTLVGSVGLDNPITYSLYNCSISGTSVTSISSSTSIAISSGSSKNVIIGIPNIMRYNGNTMSEIPSGRQKICSVTMCLNASSVGFTTFKFIAKR